MQVGRGQVYQAKGTYQACLGQQQDESILTPEKFIKRTSQSLVTNALQVFSPHHYLQALPSEQPPRIPWEQERQVETTFQGQGRGEEPPSAGIQLMGLFDDLPQQGGPPDE